MLRLFGKKGALCKSCRDKRKPSFNHINSLDTNAEIVLCQNHLKKKQQKKTFNFEYLLVRQQVIFYRILLEFLFILRLLFSSQIQFN